LWERLTTEDLYEAVWHARNPTHMIMIKLLIFMGLRNAELARVRLPFLDSISFTRVLIVLQARVCKRPKPRRCAPFLSASEPEPNPDRGAPAKNRPGAGCQR